MREVPEPERGAHPIIGPVRVDDPILMTVLELRYASRNRVSPRPVSTRRRFGRDVRGDRVTPPLTPARMRELDDLRARIGRGDYAVDAAKVAGAIVARLQAGRSGR